MWWCCVCAPHYPLGNVERLSFLLKSENAKCQRSTWSPGIILSMNDHSSKGYTPIFFFFNLVLIWQLCHWGAGAHHYPATRYNFKHSSPPSTDRVQISIEILKLQVSYSTLWTQEDQNRLVKDQIPVSDLWVQSTTAKKQSVYRQTGHLPMLTTYHNSVWYQTDWPPE